MESPKPALSYCYTIALIYLKTSVVNSNNTLVNILMSMPFKRMINGA